MLHRFYEIENAHKTFRLLARAEIAEWRLEESVVADIDGTTPVRASQDSGGELNSQESRLGQVAANLYGQSITEADIGGRITTGLPVQQVVRFVTR